MTKTAIVLLVVEGSDKTNPFSWKELNMARRPKHRDVMISSVAIRIIPHNCKEANMGLSPSEKPVCSFSKVEAIHPQTNSFFFVGYVFHKGGMFEVSDSHGLAQLFAKDLPPFQEEMQAIEEMTVRAKKFVSAAALIMAV